jgi:drug/metabolite transporter (DMT)-like permease
MMTATRQQGTARLALAIGVVAAGSAVCLATYFAIQGPFGTINDLGNGTAGVLSAGLAWRLRRQLTGRTRDLAVGAAIAGAGLTVTGSALVISDTTGFFLAGLVSSLGFAGIGTWLIALNRSEAATAAWPVRLRGLGVTAGVLMALGFISSPGIVLRLDDMAHAPAWVWVGSVSWLGTFVVYPAWAIWLANVETRRAGQAIAAPTGPVPG